jgi:hypothetical protein
MLNDREPAVSDGDPPMTLEGLDPHDRSVLFQKLGPDQFFKIVRRDAVRNESAAVEDEIRLRARMREERRQQERDMNPGVLSRLRRRWSGWS